MTLTDVREAGLRVVRSRRVLPFGLAEALALFITLRLSLGLLALMLSAMEQLPGPCFHHGVADWPVKPELVQEGLAFQTIGVWERWDSCWFLRIAEHGYGPHVSGDPSTAYFPAYPVLTRGVGELLGSRMVLGGIVVSGLAYIAAMVGLYRLVLRDFDEDTARRTTLYLSVFPTAFFLFAPYTEALFLAASVWAIYAARMRWWTMAALSALLAGLTRAQGVALALPLAWEAAQALRGEWRSLKGSPENGRPLWQRVVPIAAEGGRRIAWRAVQLTVVVLAPVAGLVTFFLYTRHVGASSPLKVQAWWGVGWYAPWTVVRVAWDWSFNQPDSPWRELQVVNAFNLFTMLGFIAVLAAGARWLPLSYTLFAAPQLLLVASRLQPTPLTSTSRYLLVLFPVFVILALLGRRRWVDQFWLVLSLLFLGFLTVAFLRNSFIA